MEVHLDADGDVIVVVVGTNLNIVGAISEQKKKGKRKKREVSWISLCGGEYAASLARGLSRVPLFRG